jgi:hypothetical protein
MEPSLQPLHIPAGWVVALNVFQEADPTLGAMLYEDMLRLTNPGTNRLLDLARVGCGTSARRTRRRDRPCRLALH